MRRARQPREHIDLAAAARTETTASPPCGRALESSRFAARSVLQYAEGKVPLAAQLGEREPQWQDAVDEVLLVGTETRRPQPDVRDQAFDNIAASATSTSRASIQPTCGT